MPQTWPAKAPTGVRIYTWEPEIEARDDLATVSVSVTTGTVTASAVIKDRTARVTVSGGAAGEEALLTVTLTTDDGQTLVEGFYIPVRAIAAAYTQTVRDVCNSALRKVVGIRRTPTAIEMEFAVETLNDMLASWRLEGLDVGLAGELEAADTLTLPESYFHAIKLAMQVELADQFDRPLTAALVTSALNAKRALLNSLTEWNDLGFEGTLVAPRPMRSIDDI